MEIREIMNCKVSKESSNDNYFDKKISKVEKTLAKIHNTLNILEQYILAKKISK